VHQRQDRRSDVDLAVLVGSRSAEHLSVLVRARHALVLDLEQASVRRGLIGTLVVLVTILSLALLGQVGLTAALAALMVIIADQPGPARERWTGVLVVTALGSAIALLAAWAGSEHLGIITLVAMAVTALGTLASAFGHAVAIRGLVLSLWAVIALSFAGLEEPALALAVAFLVGGLVATAILWVGARMNTSEGAEPVVQPVARSLDKLIHSPLAAYALVRAVAVGVAIVLGVTWFPQHPIWPALTVLLVMRPKLGEALEAGVLRTVGTLGGVLLAEAVVMVAGDRELIVFAAFVLAAFAMAALHGVNYVLFVLFVTTLIILTGALLGGDVTAAATQRLLATILGAIIALAGIGIVRVTLERGKTRDATGAA
jgi:MFS family permease